MQPFLRVDAVALPIASSNVNTDQIIPARFLRKQRADGFGQYLFHDLRFDDHEHERADFALNQPAYRDAQIIVAGPNFGCGSSREMAVWAIADYGIRAVIAASFGDIFFNNCVRNGVLCVVLPPDAVASLLVTLEDAPGAQLSIDLESQTVSSGDAAYRFDVDPFNRKCLLLGIDGIDYTLQFAERIAAFEARASAPP
jgi:3-isopropylmalate/(R)-2-methylmalate dehydratase small subunit